MSREPTDALRHVLPRSASDSRIRADLHHRNRQERLEVRRHADRPRARATSAVGRRESLVQIDVDHVEAHRRRASPCPGSRSGWRRRSTAARPPRARRREFPGSSARTPPASRDWSASARRFADPPPRAAARRSTLPSRSVGISRTAIATHRGGGRVGAMSRVRHDDFSARARPRATRCQARIIATPANSPCAPAIGARLTPAIPVTSLSIS